jgi:site-specific DNA-cytosine methylase
MRHASFFSGVGGLDLGFERAGIKTVSVCEIEPYASAVLAERFPGAPNLGNITEVNADAIPEAEVWSGGFPCQDLSAAGKRAGFAGNRSSLAFTYLDLVEQRKPRWLVLENVPGLFTSNQGRDFGRLIYEMEGLGYGVAWRVLDARFFGVAQRRRRVFIVASFGTDRAGSVLFECEGCKGHFGESEPPRQTITPIAARGATSFGNGYGNQPTGTAAYPDGNRAAHGLARRVDGKQKVAGSLTGGGSDSPQSERIFSEHGQAPTLDTGRAIPMVFRKSARVSLPGTAETWVDDGLANTLNSFDVGDIRTTHAIVGGTVEHDGLPAVGLDSHRYRCCGNGVVAPVAQWIGERLIHANRHWREEEQNG